MYFNETHLTSILAPLGVAGADHALGHIEVAVLQPLVAQVSVEDGHLHFIYCWLVF